MKHTQNQYTLSSLTSDASFVFAEFEGRLALWKKSPSGFITLEATNLVLTLQGKAVNVFNFEEHWLKGIDYAKIEIVNETENQIESWTSKDAKAYFDLQEEIA